MWADIKAIYRNAGRFALAFPLLFLIPVLVEMAQHVVEIQAGMYLNEAGAKAAEGDPVRLWFGFAKTLAIGLPSYWFVRYLLLGDAARAVRIEWPAIGLWLVVFALSAIQAWWSLFGPEFLAPLGLAERRVRGDLALQGVGDARREASTVGEHPRLHGPSLHRPHRSSCHLHATSLLTR